MRAPEGDSMANMCTYLYSVTPCWSAFKRVCTLYNQHAIFSEALRVNEECTYEGVKI